VQLLPSTMVLLGWTLPGGSLTLPAMFGFVIASLGVILVARHQPGAEHPEREVDDALSGRVGLGRRAAGRRPD